MGINFSFLSFFDACSQQRAVQGPILALGSQEIHETAERIRDFAEVNGYRDLARTATVRNLFKDRYHAAEYKDCDLNEKADVRLDLNKTLDPWLVGSAMTVLNGGTLEHVFDLRQALANVHDLVRPGGSIIHLAPLSWYEHGYVNFNPRLFSAIAEANGYELLAEAFHFTSDILGADTAGTPALYITFDGVGRTPHSDAILRLFSGSLIPSNVLYLVAYRRTQNRPFSMPYDIQL